MPLILHICGRTVDRMGYHRRDGDGRVPLRLEEQARRIDGGRRTAAISLVGNVNNPETLYSQGPARGARPRCVENLDAGVQMIGPECAIPLQTPIENLLAIRDTVSDWHAERAGVSGRWLS